MERETQKILGSYRDDKIVPADFPVSAQCNRVPVYDGHMEAVSIKVKNRIAIDELVSLLQSYRGFPQEMKLPSAPENPIVVFNEPDKPQPALNVWTNSGMSACVGRIRECNILDYKMIVLGHNTIRGAAGAAVLNAETFYRKGYLDS